MNYDQIIESLNNELGRESDSLTDARSSCREYEEQCADLRRELLASQEEARRIGHGLKRLQEDRDEALARHQDTEDTLHDTIVGLQKENDLLQDEAAAYENALSTISQVRQRTTDPVVGCP